MSFRIQRQETKHRLPWLFWRMVSCVGGGIDATARGSSAGKDLMLVNRGSGGSTTPVGLLSDVSSSRAWASIPPCPAPAMVIDGFVPAQQLVELISTIPEGR